MPKWTKEQLEAIEKSGTNIEMPVTRISQENGVKNTGLQLRNKPTVEEVVCY